MLFLDVTANFQCVCVWCVCVYVVYEDTNLYNDMGMTGITREGDFVEDIFSVLIIQNI